MVEALGGRWWFHADCRCGGDCGGGDDRGGGGESSSSSEDACGEIGTEGVEEGVSRVVV